ncbi:MULTISPECIES: protein kinase [unclassified Streptomyces]|uniref:serine/threonine-protein kinase n=1 Tax=unclassified Streptomyces TaxID=2593676 RepID=UPI00365DAA38
MDVLGDGRYALLEHLGDGGMGDVWRAEDRLMGRAVAVKLLRVEHMGNAEMQRRFLREWQVTARLEHENVVRAYDCGWGESGGQHVMFLVMEALDGTSLRGRMALPGNRQLPVKTAIRWGGQICRALEAAHAHGLVHRDLKPANVQITSDDKAVLLDFGIACFQEDEEGHTRITPAGWVVGTGPYMSPEQSRGEPVSGRSDLYSLGCLLYAMLTGRPPFTDGDVLQQHRYALPLDPRAHRRDIPDDLNALVMDLLEKRPEDRPATAAEVRGRLGRVDTRRAQQQEWSSHEFRSEATPSPPSADHAGRAGHAGRDDREEDHEEPAPEPGPRAASPRRPVPRPLPARGYASGLTEWFEMTGAGLITGLGTFALLLGAGGVGTGASLLWGSGAAVVLLLVGVMAEYRIADGVDIDGALGCVVLLAYAVLLAGCVWLMAVRADFPWYYDLLIGLGLSMGATFLTVVAFTAGDETGLSQGAGVLAMLGATLLGFLSSVLFASQLHFAWWSTLMSGLGVATAGLLLILGVYVAAA